ncbi:DNA-binding CsgD family transcriptional regulator [Streptomyces griseochromogenes]|uniref:DNA-binding CsgD family transcriptional regulator n=1 Tax=Streptomyces griseochromogenes TaxID=68214 RepID=A0A1B1APH2_9ACTN|nr:helix-turn-helix transcriptional regulator [Streptomyces griseochromogenes]ANP48469.1 helix-turn-helix transcriptional regulator [Streptomyces griseochromogenes]MBP2052861.1 DNA-binding CsgD family transcriptional regulator [Streptomyces griseochromogenes]
MTTKPHQEHGAEDLCPAAVKLYTQALTDGHVRADEAGEAPCLTDLGLLHPALDDPARLEPVAPAAALNQLLRGSRARVADEYRREEQLVEQFEPLLRTDGPQAAGTGAGTPLLRLHSGSQRINQALTEAMEETYEEVLCIQPHYSGLVGPRGEAARETAFRRDQRLLDRGGRIRTLFQHTAVHLPAILGYNERLTGDSQARCLDELTDRLIVMDRKAAFIPADDDGTLALEVRHPALVGYFATTFDRLWRLATPMYPEPVRRPTLNGVTPRQRAIAALLVEGHTDAVIADRLGMNVRTARDHIARLAVTLGSEGRAQLGYLIARSGILEPEEAGG